MNDFDKVIDNIVDDGEKPVTYVAIILDESGSMGSIATEVVGGFNTEVDLYKERSKEGILKISLIKFSHIVNVLFWHKNPNNIEKIEIKQGSYMPSGMTALCDAVGLVIKEFEEIAEKEPAAAFLVNIISDGEENSSQKFKASDIKESIEKLTVTGKWTFTYLGANQNMWDVSRKFGINIGNTQIFEATSVGTMSANNTRYASLDTYFGNRSKGVTTSSTFYDVEDDKKDYNIYKNTGA